MARQLRGDEGAVYRGVVDITYAAGHYAAGQSTTLYLGPFLTENGAVQAIAYQKRWARQHVTGSRVQRAVLRWEDKQPAVWVPV